MRLFRTIKGWFNKENGEAFRLKSQQVFNDTEKGIRQKYINLPEAEAAEKLSNAQASLINAIKDIPEAVACNEYVIVVKTTDSIGRSNVQSFTLTSAMQALIEKHPRLLKVPSELLDALGSVHTASIREGKKPNQSIEPTSVSSES